MLKPISKDLLYLFDKSFVQCTYPRLGQVRSGQVRSGQVRSGQVRSGQVRLGQVSMDSIFLQIQHVLKNAA